MLTVPNRASTVTIIRIPYIGALNAHDDFLYTVTTVGTLSTIELGIGIITVAATTLRPLFRTCLARSQLDSLSVDMSRTWVPRPRPAGYIRSQGNISLFNKVQSNVRTDSGQVGSAV